MIWWSYDKKLGGIVFLTHFVILFSLMRMLDDDDDDDDDGDDDNREVFSKTERLMQMHPIYTLILVIWLNFHVFIFVH